MSVIPIGIIMNGVTGRMGTNQHLKRSICAIRDQGGVKLADGRVIMPDPILTGRNEVKLSQLAQETGIERFTTDLDSVLRDDYYQIFFDASGTQYRPDFIRRAVAAGKAIYCEKPTASDLTTALELATIAEEAGVKNGAVQDKLWLPGMQKFLALKQQGFFGDILSVRGEFGYWVFTGHDEGQPAQRPSWNYRAEDGGGIIIDMLCHWRYVVDNLFGDITSVSCLGATHVPERIDEHGQPYACTADDSCYATFELANGTICHFNSSWTVRVRRDDLLTMQVDGTKGSAIVTLRDCLIQAHGDTPKPVWNPDVEQPINFFDGWQTAPGNSNDFENAFKAQWELFLKHVVDDAPYRWDLREAAKGVQLADLGVKSWQERRWVDVPNLSPALVSAQ